MVRSMIVPVVLLLLCCSASAWARGVSIAWGPACLWDGGPSVLHSACTSNDGTVEMTVSFIPDDINGEDPDVLAFKVTLLGVSDGPEIPPWWQLGAGECREGAISLQTHYDPVPDGLCLDAWNGMATVSYAYGVGLPNYAVLTVQGTLSSAVQLLPGLEYVACRVVIDGRNTTGTGQCTRCEDVMLWVVHDVELTCRQGSQVLEGGGGGFSFCLGWQGEHLRNAGCESFLPPLPTHSPSWGQIKSLYR
jgi:hypothetical protein